MPAFFRLADANIRDMSKNYGSMDDEVVGPPSTFIIGVVLATSQLPESPLARHPSLYFLHRSVF